MPLLKERGYRSTALKNIQYITDPQKTTDETGKRWVETRCMAVDGAASPEELYAEFVAVNSIYKKNQRHNDRKYYHIIINFKNTPQVTAEMAMDIGRAYMEKYFDGHQAVMAVHLDTDGKHFHGCANSINAATGKKMDRSRAELIARKDFVNEISQKLYGIEPFDWRAAVKKRRDEDKEKIPSEKSKNLSSEEISMRKTRSGEEISLYSWKERIRVAIAQSAMHTTSRTEFEYYLKKVHGVTMSRNTAKTVSFTIEHANKLRTIRGGQLGAYYTAENIDFWLEYTRMRKEKQELAKVIPYVPVYEIVALRDDDWARNYNIRFNENGHRRGTLELLGLLALTVLKTSPTNMPKNGLKFTDRDGNIVYAQTDKTLQAMYDAIVYCRERGFESHSDAYEHYEETRKELFALRKQERHLKGSVKKMKHIAELIENKKRLEEQLQIGEGSSSELKQVASELHKAAIHKDEDIEDFQKRFQEIRERAEKIGSQVKRVYKEKQRLLTTLDNLDQAQTSMYRYGLDAKKEAAKTMAMVEEGEQSFDILRDDEGYMPSIDAVLDRAKAKEEYEKMLRENGRGEEEKRELDLNK